ncbi:hypothetical protein BLNAU_18027 [Blattamonas nauphoetae]|uniref:Uncharacterized protein n=1 Tax=Blattamonas nauphoetae TaxID=2049346 RepID=A0ABQ9X5R3_9EUKA|nr:hypothetical protein BLNAU_18027 [Blattamonas nauphoetae]
MEFERLPVHPISEEIVTPFGSCLMLRCPPTTLSPPLASPSLPTICGTTTSGREFGATRKTSKQRITFKLLHSLRLAAHPATIRARHDEDTIMLSSTWLFLLQLSTLGHSRFLAVLSSLAPTEDQSLSILHPFLSDCSHYITTTLTPASCVFSTRIYERS